MINKINVDELYQTYTDNVPFDHVIIDDFWEKSVADEIVREMNDMPKQGMVTRYNSPLENKITIPHWDMFSKTTYQAFTYLNSEFLDVINSITNLYDLKPDVGLHGGGIHFHPTNGNLNLHKDYSIHPKLGMMRKLNLIIYMNPVWKEEWNGHLEFWSHDEKNNSPKECWAHITPVFNRAVLFDVSQDGWHGLPSYTKQPDDIYRQSMAIYYMTKPDSNIEIRPKALFAPRDEQKHDEKIHELIRSRSGMADNNTTNTTTAN